MMSTDLVVCVRACGLSMNGSEHRSLDNIIDSIIKSKKDYIAVASLN